MGMGVPVGVCIGKGTDLGAREGAGGKPNPSGQGPSGTLGEIHCAGDPSLRRVT